MRSLSGYAGLPLRHTCEKHFNGHPIAITQLCAK